MSAAATGFRLDALLWRDGSIRVYSSVAGEAVFARLRGDTRAFSEECAADLRAGGARILEIRVSRHRFRDLHPGLVLASGFLDEAGGRLALARMVLRRARRRRNPSARRDLAGIAAALLRGARGSLRDAMAEMPCRMRPKG